MYRIGSQTCRRSSNNRPTLTTSTTIGTNSLSSSGLSSSNRIANLANAIEDRSFPVHSIRRLRCVAPVRAGCVGKGRPKSLRANKEFSREPYCSNQEPTRMSAGGVPITRIINCSPTPSVRYYGVIHSGTTRDLAHPIPQFHLSTARFPDGLSEFSTRFATLASRNSRIIAMRWTRYRFPTRRSHNRSLA